MLIKEASAKYSQVFIKFNVVVVLLILSANQLFAQLIPAKTIPEFTFYKLNGLSFTQKQLNKKGKILFLFFDATCPHCQYETQQLAAHYQDFKNTSFYIVSMDKKQQIQNFINTYGKPLAGKNNVTVLMDVNREFMPKFMPSQYPALFIYNADHHLLKSWDTPVGMDQVLSVIYKD